MPSEERINSIILLKHTLEKVAPILEALQGCRSGLLISIKNVFLQRFLINDSYAPIQEFLQPYNLLERSSMKTQHGPKEHSGYAIKDVMQSKYIPSLYV